MATALNKLPENGIIQKLSARSVDETVAKLKAVLHSKGVTLFVLVDHSGEAEKVGSPTTALNTSGSATVCPLTCYKISL